MEVSHWSNQWLTLDYSIIVDLSRNFFAANLNIDPHPISYSWTKKKKTFYRRRQSLKAIFPTLNHGTLSFDLAKPDINITTSIEPDIPLLVGSLLTGEQLSLKRDFNRVYHPTTASGTLQEVQQALQTHYQKEDTPVSFWTQTEGGALKSLELGAVSLTPSLKVSSRGNIFWSMKLKSGSTSCVPNKK